MEAKIRPVQPSDERLVRFMVGKAEMSPIATANRKVYGNPLALALWLGVSTVCVQYMDLWPKPEHGWMGYLAPVPAAGAFAIAMMFGADWLNRWTFDERSSHVLRRPDLIDIPGYYSRSPSSGFWILERGDQFVGMIALDASLDAASDAAVVPIARTTEKPEKVTKPAQTKGTATTASIRHFYVEEQYRSPGAQDDLLEHALRHCFTADPKVLAVRAAESPLSEYIGRSLAKHGFVLERKTDVVGAMRWQNSIRILDRNTWSDIRGSGER